MYLKEKYRLVRLANKYKLYIEIDNSIEQIIIRLQNKKDIYFILSEETGLYEVRLNRDEYITRYYEDALNYVEYLIKNN